MKYRALIKPSMSHLQVFRCIAYAKIPSVKRTKLEDKRDNFFLIRHGDRIIQCMLYNLITNKVLYNKDVIFKKKMNYKDRITLNLLEIQN